jgi:CheY-like chemotaxis protein
MLCNAGRGKSMGVARILIVEDDNETADFLNLLLSKNGYCVTDVVATGEGAVVVALNTHPDLILMDIKLNGNIDGIMAREQIKKSSDIPVIFVSAYGDKDVIDRAMQTKPAGYVVKPFKKEQLITEIKKALDWHKAKTGKIK